MRKKRRSETILVHSNKREPHSAANDKLRHTWGINRSINHKYGVFVGGYVRDSAELASLPEKED